MQELELAAILYVADECDTVEEARLNLDRVRAFMAAAKDAKHDGDCTKQCHTCLRCLTDDYRREARIVEALSRPTPVDADAVERGWGMLERRRKDAEILGYSEITIEELNEAIEALQRGGDND